MRAGIKHWLSPLLWIAAWLLLGGLLIQWALQQTLTSAIQLSGLDLQLAQQQLLIAQLNWPNRDCPALRAENVRLHLRQPVRLELAQLQFDDRCLPTATTASASTSTAAPLLPPRWLGDLHLQVAQLRWTRYPDLHASVSAHYQFSQQTVEGQLITSGHLHDAALELRSGWSVDLNQQQLTAVPTFSLQHAEGDIDGHGLLVASTTQWQAQLQSTLKLGAKGEYAVNLSIPNQALSTTAMQGHIALNSSAAHTALQLELQADFTLAGQQLGLTLAPTDNQLHWQQDGIALSLQPDLQLALDLSAGQLSITGSSELYTPYGDLQLALSEPTRLSQTQLSGSYRAEGRLSWQQPEIQSSAVLHSALNLTGTPAQPTLTATALSLEQGRFETAYQLSSQAWSLALETAQQIWPQPLQQPLSAELAFADLSLRGTRIPSLHGQLQLDPRQRSAQLQLRQQQASATLTYQHSPQLLTLQLQQLALAPYASLVDPQLNLVSGTVNGYVRIDAPLQAPKLSGSFSLQDLSGVKEEMLFDQISLSGSVHGSPEQLRLAGQLQGDRISAGIPLTAIQSRWQLDYQPQRPPAFQVNQLSAQLLGGQLSAAQLNYPDNRAQPVLLKQIDAGQLAALQSEPMIALSGRIGGRIPLALTQGQLSVEQGQLYNQGPLQLELVDRQALRETWRDNAMMTVAIESIEQLDITALDAQLSMASDGETVMQAKVEGRNPQQRRPIVLNYQHQENLYDLLESIQISDKFQKKLQQQLEKRH